MLAGFDHTHHQIGNVVVTPRPGRSGPMGTDVFCYGTATHHNTNTPGGRVWTVMGTYTFHVVRTGNGGWQVERMVFRLNYQDDNLDLPKLAADRLKK